MMALFCWLVAAAPIADNVWHPVFGAAGLSADEAGPDLTWLETHGRGAYRNALFDALLRDPLRVPEFSEVTGRALIADAPSLGRLLYRAGSLAGWGVRRGLVEPIADRYRARLDPNRPLVGALARVRQVGGAAPSPPGDAPTDDLPRALQEAVGLILVAVAEVPTWRRWAFEDTPAAGLPRHIADLRAGVLPGAPDDGTDAAEAERRVDRIIAGFDPAAMSAAAGDLAAVIDDAREKLTGADLAAVTTRRWGTPFGDVVIAGPGGDLHEGDSPLLIVDVAGDDVYHTGAVAAAADRPVSIILDLAGADRYEDAGTEFTWGVGVAGIGLLVDVAGNDTYAGGEVSQGAGVAGIGAVWDAAGDDTYTATRHAQGAGVWGLGVLADLSGDDRYVSVQYSQGYGFTLGAGVLVDVDGRDEYVADDQNLIAPSAQTAEHNSSLSQGFGFGRRADYTNGHSLAGGIGWLVDGAGDDRYSCGVFGQGGGYWFGIGGLTDLAGNDEYRGVWYVQGAAAHYAVGSLLDAGGNDRYEATMNMAQGAGHDFSLGWLADLAGDDRYQAPNLALGAGNANGVGFLLEVAGDDTYQATDGLNLGRARTGRPQDVAASTRRFQLSAGWFLDLAGRDAYPREVCGDGRSWTHREDGQRALGAGVDR